MKKRTILIHGVPNREFYDKLILRKDVGKIYVTEFRPALLGAKLVCKELLKRKLTPILVCDNMVGFCLEKRIINEVNIFFKSQAKDGAFCFVGSLIYAICAKNNRVKVFLHKAEAIKKAFKPNEVLEFCGKRVAVTGVQGYVPLWEKVPLELIKK